MLNRPQRICGLCGLIAAAGLSVGTGIARAEPPPQGPSTAPDPTQPGKPMTEQPSRTIVPRIIVAPSSAPALEPVRPNVPPAASQDLTLATSPPLLREGALVSSAPARIVKGKSGRWYAIFEPDGSGVRLPPMIVLENSYLGAMERATANSPEGSTSRTRISGRALVYRDRNFLLPTAPPILERIQPETAPEPKPAPAATEKPPQATEIRGGEPSIDQIVADLDKAVGSRTMRPVAPPVDAGTSETPERGVTSGFLTSRRARIVRAGDGSPMAVVDSGSAGRTEGPFILIPCQNLTNIESILDTAPEGASFTLTGEVYSYKSRRYLLPTMYQVVKSSDNIMPAH